MSGSNHRTALIIGAGSGISAALTRMMDGAGMQVAVAARNVGKLAGLCAETNARAFATDASDAGSMADLFEQVGQWLGVPDVVVYNASARAHGPVGEIDPAAVGAAIATTAFGGFLAVHHAARCMVPRGSGTILLTGASASVKGFALSSAFAMGKFALRGLAQSAARELGPKGIHVAHVIIDGSVRKDGAHDPLDSPDSTLSPESIARTYMDLMRQPRDSWSQEAELRPWRERF